MSGNGHDCGASGCVQKASSYSGGAPVCHLHSNHFDPPRQVGSSNNNSAIEEKLDMIIELLKVRLQ